MTTKAFRRVAVLFAVVALALAGCATAVVLPDGRVYILAGTAKIYDPATGAISLAPSPTIPTFWSTTTLLEDGKVLIAGGIGGDITQQGATSANAQLFDPAAGTYAETGAMNESRALHTATLLQDGKVLVTGGGTPNMSGPTLSGDGASPGPTPPPLNSAELYDPATGTWTPTGAMEAGLAFHTANLLQDGRVLVVGAEQTSENSGRMVAQLYDPGSGTFTGTAAPTDLRALQTATTLTDGRVLMVGGVTNAAGATAGQSPPLASAEIYDPGSGTWSAAGEVTTARVYHAASILDDGRVLVVGGLDPLQGSTGLTSAEIYDPAANSWSPTGDMTTATIAPVASLLQDGTVLVAGIGDTSAMGGQAGSSNIDFINAAELYDPAAGTFSPVEVEVATGSPAPSGAPDAEPSAS